MALLAIEWRIGQRLFGVNRTNWQRVMDHLLKVYKGFACLQTKFIFSAFFDPHALNVG